MLVAGDTPCTSRPCNRGCHSTGAQRHPSQLDLSRIPEVAASNCPMFFTSFKIVVVIIVVIVVIVVILVIVVISSFKIVNTGRYRCLWSVAHSESDQYVSTTGIRWCTTTIIGVYHGIPLQLQIMLTVLGMGLAMRSSPPFVAGSSDRPQTAGKLGLGQMFLA